MARSLWKEFDFTFTNLKLKTVLDGEEFVAKLDDLPTRIWGVENFYRGYIKALSRVNGVPGRRVDFEWVKNSRNSYHVRVYANPAIPTGGGGGGTQNPGPGTKPPPSM